MPEYYREEWWLQVGLAILRSIPKAECTFQSYDLQEVQI